MHKPSGFTLVELILVLAIMGIFLSIGIPQFLHRLPNVRLRAAVRDLYSQMQNSKINAIKNNADWAIVFIPARNRYLVCSGPGPDGSWSSPEDNTIVTQVDLSSYGSGIQFGHGTIADHHSVSHNAFPVDNVSYNGNVLTFNPLTSCSAGYAYLENQQHLAVYAVGTLSSGAIRILNWTGTAWK